ncbi:far upstream element-binding protein 3 isoform X2 [Galleria mellonella]|uniref:Far upstream element-binding protein 3 isoform X2 n=1 Tax=Galleria mellonella TaxID=7137 RepID=A0A6J1WCF3_GALME|nr:far upstream element-binding protein 3 isoform X2 [Galleria mellonella]
MSDYPSMATLQNNSQTAGYANALQRARLVAAKLVGGSKRPLEEGTEPSPKKSATVESNYQQQSMSATAAATAAAAAAAAAARISASCGAAGVPPAPPSAPPNFMPEQTIDERIRVPDKMVGLIIGRGGEQITRLQAESGCKIQMAPDSGGQPDRICTLTGSREAIQRAKELVNQIVNHRGRENAPQHPDNAMGNMGGGGAGSGMPPLPRGGGLAITEEVMLPGPKVGLIIGKNGKTIKQLQEQSGAKMVVIQDGPNTEYEKPLRISGDPSKVEHAKQLVYELLAEKDMGIGGGQRSQYDDAYSPQDQGNGLATNSTEVSVPKIAVGVVIGRGGDMIKKIQAETGCRVQFHQERDDGPGDKRCYLQGKPHQVEQAKQMIDDLISSVNGANEHAARLMRRDQEVRSGPGRGRGGSGQRNGDRGDYQQWQENPEIRVTFTVSNVKCGLIIGRGGEVIKQMNAQTGAHCEVDRRATGADRNTRTFYIRGHPDAVEACKRLIMEKVGMPINFIQDGGNNGGGGGAGGAGGEYYGGGGGGNGGGPPAWGYNPQWQQVNPSQQPQINPLTGQPDYSQQWIDYYRSLGLMREAEAVEQQAKQQQAAAVAASAAASGAPTSAAGGGPGAGAAAGAGAGAAAGAGAGAADYSAQWAEYYRNIGKIKEAEAIEAQMKLKQQQAQAGAVAQPPQTAQQTAASPQQQQQQAAGGPPGNGAAMMGGQYQQQYPMYSGAMYPGYAPYPYSASSGPDQQQ